MARELQKRSNVDALPVVLLLESNPHFRRLLASELRRCKYAVTDASCGNDVIEQIIELLAYANDGSFPCLVIGPIQVEPSSGLTFSLAMRIAKYDVPVLLMARFREPTLEARVAQVRGCRVIFKPFNLATFLETARTMIDSALLSRALHRSS